MPPSVSACADVHYSIYSVRAAAVHTQISTNEEECDVVGLMLLPMNDQGKGL